jgi:DNA-binding NarL/FixJ family response regulator
VTQISVLVVDDHAMVRSALARGLDRDPELQVVAEAADAEQAVEEAQKRRPDVVIMDIDMPGPICFEAARRITEDVPQTKVIFLSAFFHDHYVEEALAVKARGYLTKREPQESLVAAVKEVARGGVCFSEEVRDRIVADEDGMRLIGERTRGSKLTRREVEVLRYLARGMSKKEIAATMHRSVKTVENHCSNIMKKLDIHDRVELALYAIREGLAEA